MALGSVGESVSAAPSDSPGRWSSCSGCWAGVAPKRPRTTSQASSCTTSSRAAVLRGDGCAIVVGAGLAGLSAAWAIVESGCRVIILEKRSRCGGSSTASAVAHIRATSQTVAKADSEAFRRILDSLGLAASDVSPSVVVKALSDKLEQSAAARIVTRARVIRLLVGPDGACVGCVYSVAGGKDRQEHGPVIVCTGGFGADFSGDSLLALHRPDLLHLPTTCAEHATGDGVRLVAPFNAQITELRRVHLTALALVRPGNEIAKAKVAAPQVLCTGGGFLLDADGDRFCDERSTPDKIASAMRKSRGPFRLVIAELAANALAPGLSEHYVSRGLARRFESLEAVARGIGVPVSRLEASCTERLRADVDQCSNTSASGGGGSAAMVCPYIVASVVPAIRCCLGGLAVDAQGAVLDADRRARKGLFAAGEAAACLGALPAAMTSAFVGDDCAVLRCLAGGSAAGKACLDVVHALGRKVSIGSEAQLHGISEEDSSTACLASSPERIVSDSFVADAVPSTVPRTGGALAEAESLLNTRLTETLLESALARVHEHDGCLDVAVDVLRQALCGGSAVLNTRGTASERRVQCATMDNDGVGPVTPNSSAVSMPARAVVRCGLRDCGTPGAGPPLPTASRQILVPRVGEPCAEGRVSCIHCRFPLHVDVSCGVASGSENAELPVVHEGNSQQRCAYATLLYGDKVPYFLGALVTGWSLKATGSTVDRILLHTDDVPQAFEPILKQFWKLRRVDYLEGSQRMYKNYARSRFKAVFTKLQALSCTEYDKVLMLDLDMLIRRNVDDLFSLPAPAAMKRASGKEQPPHGGIFRGEDLWRTHRDDMCSGINAGVMLLEPCKKVYERMVAEIKDPQHPEHVGTYGPEQDYLSRFYCAFMGATWTHLHARYNYQLMLPDDYVSSEHRNIDIESGVFVAHYSGPRVKPWELNRDVPLGVEGVRRLLEDDSVRNAFGGGEAADRRRGPNSGRQAQPRERIMDGVRVVEHEEQSWALPANVQDVMFEWVIALRKCATELKTSGAGELLGIIEGHLQSLATST
eukprot:TRINITY_DN25504_c0_g1_i1.p1 TRINITY_DN25504_c0_g1~~TRINITY_DN25504_c0_g1_i1.p1  ORF type:complete len:1044 (+),score=174.76 TRINITY_DN25504_c0_g1_i1:63-3194(+)